jgi:putative transposase
MTATYYSLNEIKGLPGLPLADRALRALAATWESRPRVGKGGGIEYSSQSLPPAALAAIEQRKAYALIPFDLRAEYGYPSPHIRPEQARADAKAWYLHALETFTQVHELTITKAREYFTLAIKLGLITIPQTVEAIVNKISITTLRRWEQIAKIAGLDKLNGMWRGRKSQLDIFAELSEDFKSLLIYSCKKIELELRERFKNHKIPSLRAISNYKRKFIKEHPRECVRTIEGDAAYKNKFGKGKEGSWSESVLAPNQLWMLDGTKTDVLLADGTRYWIIGAIDVFSRRVVLSLSKSNNSDAVVNGLLFKGLMKLGVPTTLKIDNGSEYINNQFENACRELEIDIDRCDGGSPWQKGLIERFFGTLTAQCEKGLPGYVGANIKERAAFDKITGTLTPEQFQAKLDTYLEYYSNKQEHSSIGCTPMEKWAQGVASGTVIRTIENPQVLMRLLTVARKRRVGAAGIQYDSYKFASESMVYEEMKGQDIWVKMEPSNASIIYCLDRKGEYLFTAFCPELIGMTRAELVARIKKNRKGAKKYKQSMLTHMENTEPEKHAALISFQKSEPANLPAIEQAKRLQAEIQIIEKEREEEKTVVSVFDVAAQETIPLDSLDRYTWYRARIHSGQTTTSGVIDFLKSIERKKKYWPTVVDADLKYITPQELADTRAIEYAWELSQSAFLIREKHESMPWRAYQYCLSIELPSPVQCQFMTEFESVESNQSLIPILQQCQMYRSDLLNKSMDAYFDRYYRPDGDRDLFHHVAGQPPVKNLVSYDWNNHQANVQRRKEAS